MSRKRITHTRTHAHTHARTQTHTHRHKHAQQQKTHMHTHTHARTHTRTHAQTCTHAHKTENKYPEKIERLKVHITLRVGTRKTSVNSNPDKLGRYSNERIHAILNYVHTINTSARQLQGHSFQTPLAGASILEQ